MKKKKKNSEINKLWAESIQIYMQLGLTMAGCIIFCFFVGRYLDNLFHTRGIFIVVFILFGVFGGANVAYRQIIKITDPQTNNTNEEAKKNGNS